jgi:acyl-CoA dehydrogenase
VDFTIPEEYVELVASVRRFREKELMPLEADFLREGKWSNQLRWDLEERGRKLGFWALFAPEE